MCAAHRTLYTTVNLKDNFFVTLSAARKQLSTANKRYRSLIQLIHSKTRHSFSPNDKDYVDDVDDDDTDVQADSVQTQIQIQMQIQSDDNVLQVDSVPLPRKITSLLPRLACLHIQVGSVRTIYCNKEFYVSYCP